MRLSAATFSLVLISSCSPVLEPVVAPPPTARFHAKPAALTEPPATPSHPAESARATNGTFSGIVFEGVAFDARCHRLIVADQAAGPGSRFPDAASAGQAHGGLAAVNAGFFTPEGEPLGMVVASGNPAGSWNSTSSLGSGVWHENASGQSAITRRERLGRSAANGMRELIQAGPMLIENGRTVSGLDAAKSSARTLILWDGGNRWWLGRTSPCSLASLATAVSIGQPTGWQVRHALNLDGGRSSDLWISEAIPGGPISRRPAWNRPVRNFLILNSR